MNCKYCENGELILTRRAFGEATGFTALAASIYKKDDKYVFGIHQAIVSGEVEINFCPMCGNNLKN